MFTFIHGPTPITTTVFSNKKKPQQAVKQLKVYALQRGDNPLPLLLILSFFVFGFSFFFFFVLSFFVFFLFLT